MAKRKTAAEKAEREEKAAAKKADGATRDPGNPAAPPARRSDTVRMRINARPGSTLGVPDPETQEITHIEIDGDGVADVPRSCVPVIADQRLGVVERLPKE